MVFKSRFGTCRPEAHGVSVLPMTAAEVIKEVPERVPVGLSEKESRPGTRRLVVNADDFGGSSSINAAVIRAHREGILTSASLMVNESGCEEAVALARENPRLGVGLHLALLCGQSALPRE